MSRRISCSVTFDIRGIHEAKIFRTVTTLLRGAAIQEHGFRGTKGMTDARFKIWPLAIRFHSKLNRDNFINTIETTLSDELLNIISARRTIPKGNNPKPIRFLRSL